MFKRLPKLLPPPEGLDDFFATVHVRLHEPIHNIDDPAETPVQGYYFGLGVRTNAEQVQALLTSAVDDGIIDWKETEWQLTDPGAFDVGKRKRFTPVAGEGIWYRSAKVFYADPDLEPAPN